MRQSPPNKAKSKPKYIEKSPKAASPKSSPPQSPNKEAPIKNVPRPGDQEYFFNLEGKGDITADEVKQLQEKEVVGIVVTGRQVQSLELLSRLPQLRWIQLVDCRLTDSEIGKLSGVKKLETLLLPNNNISEIKGFELLKECKKLSCLQLDSNPVSKSAEKLQQLRKLLPLNLLISQQSRTYSVALNIKRDCVLTEYRNERSSQLANSLIRDVFEVDNRVFVDLMKYLRQLRSDRKSIEVAYEFLLSVKKFARDTPKITESYQYIPWVMLEEWPETNFLKEYSKKLSNLEDLLKLVEQEDPAALVESRNLDHIVHHLLDEYYALELKKLFGVVKDDRNFESLSKLVKFIFEGAIRYFQRNQDLYRRFSGYTYGKDSVTDELTMMLLKNTELIEGLELAVAHPDVDLSAKEEEKVAEVFRRIKMVKVEKMVDQARQFSTKSISFASSNLNFFNCVLKANDETQKLFDLAKSDRLELFSGIVFEEFNIRDYQDFTLFIRQGQTKSEEFFARNIDKLKLVMRLYEWLDDLEELQSNILKVPEEEKYPTTAIYFKRLLGRPKIDIKYLKRYFGFFNFDLIEKLVDSEARASSLKILMEQFRNDFSFLVRFIVEGRKNDEYDRMKEVCRRMIKPNRQQQGFMLSAVTLMSTVESDVKKNAFFMQCLEEADKSSFPLLSYSLKNNSDEKYIAELYEVTSKTRLFNYEKRFLLESLKQVIAFDATHIWLRNRDKGGFFLYIRKLADKSLFDNNTLFVRLLELSNDLYGFLLTKTSQKREHKGLLDPAEIQGIVTIEKYMQRMDKGNCVTDFLLDVLKEELYEVMFSWEQGWLTLNIVRYRQLCHLQIIEQFIGKEVLELLDLIEKNSVSDFVEIKVEPAIDWNDEEYVHDYMVAHILRPGKSKQDQFYLQNLREAYYDCIIKICLKKDMTNLAEYLPKMEKVENSFVKRGSAKISIPLLEISEIVRHRLFKNSELSRKLIHYFKSKVKTDDSSRQIREEYNTLINKIDQDKQNDNELLRLLTIGIQKNQTRVFAAFLDNLGLFIDVKEHAKIYFLIDWQLFESFHDHNHRNAWEKQHMPYVDGEMAKYQRIFLKYLTKPTQCKNQKDIVQRAFSRFQDLILNLEISAIIDEVSSELGITYPKKFSFRMIANKIHQFLSTLHAKFPKQVPWLAFFSFQYCSAVKKRIGHAGFIAIKEYFCKAFLKKPRLQPIAQQISFKMEEYEADRIIEKIGDERSFKPSEYFTKLLNVMDKLAEINSFNPDIDRELVKGRYPQLPWLFLNMKDCLRKPYWKDVLERMEKKYGVYLQVLHYLETQDKADNEGLKFFSKMFELVYAENCVDDLIRRIQQVLELQSQPLFQVMLDFSSFEACPADKLKTLDDQFTEAQKTRSFAFTRPQLLTTLRIFALRGQYLTRIEKINNKLRNMLSDFDEASLDFQDFFKKSSQKKNQEQLFRSLLKMLSILFRYKYAFFDIVKRRKYMELTTMCFKKEFARYREVDLKLKQVETVNRDSVLKYFEEVLKRYTSDVAPELRFLSSNYQQAEMYHIALFTSLRDQEKFEYIASVDPRIRQLIESEKQNSRLYRNYLAHYNCCSTLRREQGDEVVTMDESHRESYLRSFDATVRKLSSLWK